MKFEELYDRSKTLLKESPDTILDHKGKIWDWAEGKTSTFICTISKGIKVILFTDMDKGHYIHEDIRGFFPLKNNGEFDAIDTTELAENDIYYITETDEELFQITLNNTVEGRMWNIDGIANLSFWDPPEKVKQYADLIIKLIKFNKLDPDKSYWETDEEMVPMHVYLETSKNDSEQVRKLEAKKQLHLMRGLKRETGQEIVGGSAKQGEIAQKSGKDFYAKYKQFIDPYGLRESLIKEDPDAIVIGTPPNIVRFGFTEYNAHAFIGIEKNGKKGIIYNIKIKNNREKHTELIDYVARTCYLFSKYGNGSLYNIIDYLKRKGIGVIFEDEVVNITPDELYNIAAKYRNTRNIKEVFGRLWIMHGEGYGALWNPKRFARYYNVIIKMLNELHINPDECYWEINEGSLATNTPSEFVKTSEYLELSSKSNFEQQRNLDAKRALHLQPGMKRLLGQSSSGGSIKQNEIAKIAGFPTFSAYKQSFMTSESNETI